MKILTSFLGCILAIITCFAQTTQNNSWPQYMGPNRNGKINGKQIIKKEPSVLWEFEFNAKHTSPIVVDDKLNSYFGTSENELYAIDSLGKLKWKVKLDNPISLSPAIYNNVLIVMPKGANVYGLDAKSGKRIWKSNFNQKKYSGVEGIYYNNANANAPIIFDDKLYVNTSNKITTLDIKTGKTLSITQEKGVFNLDLPPLITESTIYGGSGYRYIYAFDRLTGKMKWTAETSSSYEGKPLLYKDSLYIIGKYYAQLLSPKSGKIYKKSKYEIRLKNKYGIIDNNIFYRTKSGYNYGSFVEAVDINNDEELWTYIAKGKTISEPILIGNLLCFGDSKGYFYGLKSDDGKEVFKLYEFNGFGVVEPIAFAKGRLFIATKAHYSNKGRIVVLE